MKRLVAMLCVLGAAGAALLLVIGGASGGGPNDPLVADAAKGQLKPAKLTTKKDGKTVTRTLPFLSAGTVQAAADALSAGDERLQGADASPHVANSDFSDIGGGIQTLGCAKRNSNGNTRVNQDCSFRRQAETDITYNPVDPRIAMIAREFRNEAQRAEQGDPAHAASAAARPARYRRPGAARPDARLRGAAHRDHRRRRPVDVMTSGLRAVGATLLERKAVEVSARVDPTTDAPRTRVIRFSLRRR